MSWNDFSNADEQTGGDVIPHRTPAKVHMKIKAGGHNDEGQGWTGGMATRNDTSGSVYLNCEFTVMGGKYNKRKAWSMIGLYSSKNNNNWGNMGRSFVRAALESARNVSPKDTGETAIKARQISGLADLDGLEFCAFIDVQKADPGSQYSDKNVVQNVIPCGHKDYQALMSGAGATQTDSAAASQMGQQGSGDGGKPNWM